MRNISYIVKLARTKFYVCLQVLWTLREERLLDNLEEMITDGLFELVYTWVKDVPETHLLKKSLDAGTCILQIH